MWELTTKLEQMPTWELTPYPGELLAGRPPVSLALLVGSKPQMGDWGEVDEEGGHLYDPIKMLYKDDFCPEPVLTQGMEDAIVLVSIISSFVAQISLSPTVLSPN